jgi:hypothetical protein
LLDFVGESSSVESVLQGTLVGAVQCAHAILPDLG